MDKDGRELVVEFIASLTQTDEESQDGRDGGPYISLPLPENGTPDPSRDHPKTVQVTTNGHDQRDSPSTSDARTIIRNLTLPTVPNLDIPGSPPGSPPAAMNDKIKRFLELKQQGVHFNEKLASSSSLKNPSLLGKLSVFAGLDPADQYATTLPTELWDPQGFPSWAFKDELAKTQEQAAKLRDEQIKRGVRPGVEFVRFVEEGPPSGRESSVTQLGVSKHHNGQGDGPQSDRRRSRLPDKRNKR